MQNCGTFSVIFFGIKLTFMEKNANKYTVKLNYDDHFCNDFTDTAKQKCSLFCGPKCSLYYINVDGYNELKAVENKNRHYNDL